MIRWAARPGSLVVAATVALVAALAIDPTDPGRLLRLYVLGLAALAAWQIVARLPRAPTRRSPFEAAVGGSADDPPVRPPELVELQRMVRSSVLSAGETHRELRPLLRDIARRRLASERGLELDRGGDAVLRAVGADAWDLLRPDRPPPASSLQRGLPPVALRRIVERLERI